MRAASVSPLWFLTMLASANIISANIAGARNATALLQRRIAAGQQQRRLPRQALRCAHDAGGRGAFRVPAHLLYAVGGAHAPRAPGPYVGHAAERRDRP